jgi:hypothetical protein
VGIPVNIWGPFYPEILKQSRAKLHKRVPSNRVILSLEGKFGRVGETIAPAIDRLFRKICVKTVFAW